MPSREWNDVVDYITNLNNVSHSFNVAYNLEMSYKFSAISQRMKLTTKITKWNTTHRVLLEKVDIKCPQDAIDYISLEMDMQENEFMTDEQREIKRAVCSIQYKKKKEVKKCKLHIKKSN